MAGRRALFILDSFFNKYAWTTRKVVETSINHRTHFTTGVKEMTME